MRRRPSKPWYEEGEEPDDRFSLANERTVLAWFRTGLALMAGALAVAQFIQPHLRAPVGTARGVALAGTGTLLCVTAYRRWRSVQLAMRHNRPLPLTRVLPVLAAGAALSGVALLALITEGP
ncbi:YidH family protein [Streptomyces anulatus]|uniref:YidH family protein n=1 Tax=Streptomyces anulatus TaxID=1892 RepID=UPI00378764CC|nr:DUF202 domain-containing protein [Streptomyces anulatus]